MPIDYPWPPDYVAEFQKRLTRLNLLRASPENLDAALAFYGQHNAEACIQWIEHWGVTFDPRKAGTSAPTTMPFILFPKQKEFVRFVVACLLEQENGLVEKCRDMGMTWLCVEISVWLWRFWPGAAVGWGSRKQDLVDQLGDPKSVFEKIRKQIEYLPSEFLPKGFDRRRHCTFMKVINPENEATITGEAGAGIGRGGRTLIYFKDESAHYEHAEAIEASLGDNTNVQIDISSVNGPGNVFHRRREAGRQWIEGQPVHKGVANLFIADWSDHPEKTQEWYDARRKKAEDEGLLHIFAQEVDRDYYSALTGVIIPALWVQASIDAHIKLGFGDDGGWAGALDVGDDGEDGDLNALAVRKGVVLKHLDEWGKLDTGETTTRAVMGVRDLGPIDLQYDCIGVGAGVKAESNRLLREGKMPSTINFVPWNAGLGPLHPERRVVERDKNSPLNKDFYGNLKAQGWWELRMRFERTYRAITEPDFTWSADELISLDSTIPRLAQARKELSQPTKAQNGSLKLIVDKRPEGTRSPNMGDAIMMAYWPATSFRPMKISSAAVQQSATGPQRMTRMGGMRR